MGEITDKRHRSPRLAVLHKTAQALHRAGEFDKATMRAFDAACFTQLEPADDEPRGRKCVG